MGSEQLAVARSLAPARQRSCRLWLAKRVSATLIKVCMSEGIHAIGAQGASPAQSLIFFNCFHFPGCGPEA
jgi:hypothetical protein